MASVPRTVHVERPGDGAWFEAVDESGRRVRVHGGAPGERLRVDATKDDPDWAWCVEVLEASPVRRESPCVHDASCGGCHWLHVEEDAQRRLKAQRLGEVLAEIGEASVPVRRAVPPLGDRHRTRLQAEVADGVLRLGFHQPGSPRVLDVPRCPLHAPELHRVVAALRAAWTPRPPEGLTGCDVIALPQSEGALVTLNPRDAPPPEWPRIGHELLEAAAGLVAGVGVQLSRGDARPASVGATSALGRTAGGQPIAAALGAFSQPSAQAAEALVSEISRLADVAGSDRVLDLFAGAGVTSWRLASEGADVLAVEADERSVAAARRLPRPPCGRLRLVAGDAERIATREAAVPWDLVVADPPRSGLGGVVAALPAAARRLIVAWCDVRGARRDLLALRACGWRLERVSALDLFPQTRHFETLGLLRR